MKVNSYSSQKGEGRKWKTVEATMAMQLKLSKHEVRACSYKDDPGRGNGVSDNGFSESPTRSSTNSVTVDVMPQGKYSLCVTCSNLF